MNRVPRIRQCCQIRKRDDFHDIALIICCAGVINVFFSGFLCQNPAAETTGPYLLSNQQFLTVRHIQTIDGSERLPLQSLNQFTREGRRRDVM